MEKPKKKSLPRVLTSEIDRRGRLANLKVLVADRNHRTASLVQRVLFSFGFRNLDVTTSGESALTLLRSRSYDILITEWNMAPVNGIELVKAIRAAKDDNRLARDLPILMLTAQADKESIIIARDAGITEFVAKPFSAKTMSTRIIQIIDTPRAFVESEGYTGPCRRRRGEPPPGVADRRIRNNAVAPESSLQDQLDDATAADILNTHVVEEAQTDLLKVEDEFIAWARDDIEQLEKAYLTLTQKPDDSAAYENMRNITYTIKSQAGIFGYMLGTEAASLLVDYLASHKQFSGANLMVLRKFIDAISTIFRQGIKDNGHAVAAETIIALKKLTQKLG